MWVRTTPFVVFSVTYFLGIHSCYKILLLALVSTNKDQVCCLNIIEHKWHNMVKTYILSKKIIALYNIK